MAPEENGASSKGKALLQALTLGSLCKSKNVAEKSCQFSAPT